MVAWFCISTRRPQSALLIKEMLKRSIRIAFIVKDQKDRVDYENLGLSVILGGGLITSRNLALDIAKSTNEDYAVELSDDINFMRMLPQKSKIRAGQSFKKATHMSLELAADYVIKNMKVTGAKLGGTYPNSNQGFAMRTPEIGLRNFVVGDFIVVDTSPDVRFYPNLSLKEDYDFTAAHIATHGVVCRCNRRIPQVRHYDNPGGAVDHRTAHRDRVAAAYIMKKVAKRLQC